MTQAIKQLIKSLPIDPLSCNGRLLLRALSEKDAASLGKYVVLCRDGMIRIK